MFAQVTRLQHWKSEHDEQTCEDSYGESITHGLFAVADGAGTTLFSNIWAKILVQHFLSIPLISNDPFEVEWWVRLAQEQYKQTEPEASKMAWNAQQKMQNQGSHATLATLRFSRVADTSAEAELLVFGDSCILIKKHGAEQVQTFPLNKPADFEQAPICIPSKRILFNRYFHQCHVKHVELTAGDTIILATDAVAKWIISGGGGQFVQSSDALKQVITQTPTTWETFILECRDKYNMVDDDSTALVLALHTNEVAGTLSLGATTEHASSIRADRKNEFTRAMELHNKELIAITFGDGADLAQEGISIPQNELRQAREVADALREVLQILRQEINKPDAAAKIAPVWQRYAPLLLDEPAATNLRQTLIRLGLPVTAFPVPPPAEEQQKEQGKAAPIEQLTYFTLSTSGTVENAQAYGMDRSSIASALESKNAQNMAEAYKRIARTPHIVNKAQLRMLQAAYAFRSAYLSDDDTIIVSAFEAMQHPSYYGAFEFTPDEEKRIALAWQRKISPVVPDHPATPTLNETWLRKMCAIKEAYLSDTMHIRFSPEQLASTTLDDLHNDPLIMIGIEEVNRKGLYKLVVTEKQLHDKLENLKCSQAINYEALLANNQLTDDEVKHGLLILLRQHLFTTYLREQEATGLPEWIALQRGASANAAQQNTIPVAQGHSWFLKWVRRKEI